MPKHVKADAKDFFRTICIELEARRFGQPDQESASPDAPSVQASLSFTVKVAGLKMSLTADVSVFGFSTRV
jgi:hypothetical protein